MAFNGSGVFVRLYNWVNDAAANIKIRADRMDNEMDGFATGLSSCITKDGQTTIAANLPMATYKHTNVGAATAGTDYARADQLISSTYCGTSSGTNTITATVPLGGAFDAAGKVISFKAGGTNTGAATFNGVTIQKLGQALSAGDITTGDIVLLEHDGTNAQMLTPARFPVLANYSIKNLALDKTVLSSLTAITPATGDYVFLGDISDFDALRKTTVSDIISLAPSGPSAASQAEQETGSATNVYVSPARQQYHASAAKFWGKADAAGTLNASYNVTSITDDGVGLLTVTIATDFSSANWGCWVTVERGGGAVGTSANLIWATIKNSTQAAGAVSFECVNNSGYADPTRWHFGGFGDQ